MAINTRFNGGDNNGTEGDTHSITRSVPSSGGFGAGTMNAGDIIVINAVGGTDGGGLDVPVVSDDISGTTGWHKIGDSLSAALGLRTTKWWKLCVGSESSITVDWTTPGTHCAWEGAFIYTPGTLNEAYLIKEGLAHSHFSSMEFGRGDGTGLNEDCLPSSDGEMYVGCTSIGAHNYDLAQINGVGVHDNNGVGGDGQNAGAVKGVGIIMHINDSVGGHLTTDQLLYQSHPEEITFDSFIGIRVGGASDPPVNTVSPFIDNTTPQEGDLLTGDPGTWTGTAPITFTYQWLNYDGSDHNIVGETAITYTVQAGDVGKAIWLDVRAHSDAVAEPGVEAVSSHTDNVIAAPVDYTDAATVHLTPVMSAGLVYTPLEIPSATTVFDVNDHTAAIYVRSGRGNSISVNTTDNAVTFKLQTSPDGETWYDALNPQGETYLFAVTLGSGVAFTTPPGWFYLRLLCTVADDGPATVSIGFVGGY